MREKHTITIENKFIDLNKVFIRQVYNSSNLALKLKLFEENPSFSMLHLVVKI